MVVLKSLFKMTITGLLAGALIGCAESFTDIPKPKIRNVVSTLSGELTTTDGEVLNLADNKDKIMVLQFASDSCLICAGEAKHFKTGLKDPNVAPSKIKLISIIEGGLVEDAQDWKKRLGVPWTVAIDPDSKLFKKLCEYDQVPCLVIHTPEKGVVLSKHGDTILEEILPYTGPWED